MGHGARRSMIIGMPNRGRSVMSGHGSTLVSRHEVKPIALRQRRHAQVRFDQRELVADALSRPGAERQVDELRPIGAALRREALGIERLRDPARMREADAGRTG